MVSIFNDLQNEIEIFFDDLNWTFILIYTFVLYGIKHKEEFQWYNDLFDVKYKIKPFKIWIAGVIIMLIFSLFKHLETGLNPFYVSELMRSWILVIIFNSIFFNQIKEIDKN